MMLGEYGRTWKWAVPGLGAVVCLWLVMVLPVEWSNAKALLGMVLVLCAAVAGTNWWRFVAEARTDLLYRRRQAEAITARGMMLEAAKGVHPETLRLVLGEQARRWGLVSGTRSATGEPYAVLLARPRVTEAFLVHFLRGSMGKQYLSKRTLADGDKSWDPAGLVTAYEMYDDVVSLLEEELKCTRPFGPTKPGYWLGEWGAEAVALDWGVELTATPLSPGTATSPQMAAGERGNLGGEGGGDVIARALEGLEQTAEMRARFGSNGR